MLAAIYALPQILTQEVSAPNSAKTSAIEAFLSTLPTLLQQWMRKQRGQLWGDAGCSSNDLRRAVAHLGGQRMLSQSLLQGMRLKELRLQQLNAPRRWIDFHLAPRTATDLLLLPTPSPFLPASVINSTFQIVGVLTPLTPSQPSTKSLNWPAEASLQQLPSPCG